MQMIKKSNCEKLAMVRNLNREITILRELDHPRVIGLIDSWHEGLYVCLMFKRYAQDLFGLSDLYGQVLTSNVVMWHASRKCKPMLPRATTM